MSTEEEEQHIIKTYIEKFGVNELLDPDQKMRRITKVTEEERRIILRASLGVLDEYWDQVFHVRETNDQWSEISPFVDCFPLCEFKEPDQKVEKGKVNMTRVCLIPNQLRPFYDIILGLYVLLKPEIYRNTQYVAKLTLTYLLEDCDKLKLDFTQFPNFGVFGAGYLKCQMEGTEVSLYNTPFECIRFARYCIKEIQIQKDGITQEEIANIEEDFSKVEKALKLREKQFQDRCLKELAPTSP